MGEYTPPTPEEISRVADYWQRVKALACAHESFSVGRGEGVMCGGDCGRPLHILSDFQLEERLRAKPMADNVRDDLIAQLDRGGVTFTVDGERREFRLHAHTDPLLTDPDHECICVEAENVQLLLRATEGRRV